MRHYNILPKDLVRTASLSKDALKRLWWMDWYQTHAKNAEATCRHFGISKSVFYRWKNRYKRFNLKTLEDDTSNRRPHSLKVEPLVSVLPPVEDTLGDTEVSAGCLCILSMSLIPIHPPKSLKSILGQGSSSYQIFRKYIVVTHNRVSISIRNFTYKPFLMYRGLDNQSLID